jgi:general secretion pathway protein C
VGRMRGFFISARLFLLAVLAFWSAVAVNRVVAIWLTPPPFFPVREEHMAQTTNPPPLLSSYAVVHQRDIFHAVKAGAATEDETTIVTNGELILWGTAIRNNACAFAIIERKETRLQELYCEGDRVAPGITLVEVAWDQVTVERNGRRDVLMLSLDRAPSPPSPRDVAQAVAPDSAGQLVEHSFEIDREAIDHALANLNDLFTQARAIPYATGDGTIQGFRLFSIRPQSFVDRLGVKNGDIVQRVNGVEISDPTTAFGLLQDLQGQPRIQVDVLRNHQPVTLSYEIR